jgi:hypothetical protein
VRDWWDCSRHREPLSRTRRSVWEEDHTCPEPEETGHRRMRPEVRKRSSQSDLFRRACPRAGGGIRLWAVFPRGSTHDPSPVARAWHGARLRCAQVVKILGSRWVQTRSPSTLNRLFRLAGGRGPGGRGRRTENGGRGSAQDGRPSICAATFRLPAGTEFLLHVWFL